MSLQRYTKSVDGTIPVLALLYEDEEVLTSQDGIGIYDGTQKAPHYQSGVVHVTRHRLFYIDVPNPVTRSFSLDLAQISQTEYYGGLFKSSAKVTLFLTNPPRGGESKNMAELDSWECEVCGNRNQPGLSSAASNVCVLCGIPRSSLSPIDIKPKPPRDQHNLSSSLPVSIQPSPLSSSPSLVTPTPYPALRGRRPSTIACPACTFLNYPSLPACEICSTPLPKPSKVPQTQWPPMMKSAPSSRPASPDTDNEVPETNPHIRLSFRKGGDKSFYAIFKRSLQGKAWESTTYNKNSMSTSPDLVTSRSNAGISGILDTVEATSKAAKSDMQDSLKDLEALMIKARDMVRLAKDLNERLTAASAASSTASGFSSSSTAVEPEEATFVRSSLAQLGLQTDAAPVTQTMVKDERLWLSELARELAGVLQGSGAPRAVEGMMRSRGIMALDEVWGGWNRARGVALIPPSTFLLVLPLLSQHTSPSIHTRTFTSGLQVLHTPPYAASAFSKRLLHVISDAGPRTLVEIAQEEGMTVSLTEEMVEEAEADGGVCRDEDNWAGAGGEVKWWVDVFSGYVWDGQE